MKTLAAQVLLLCGLLAAAPLAAQQTETETAAAAEERVQRVFQIRWADTNDVYMILNEEKMGIHAITLLQNSRQVMVEAWPDVIERVEEWLRQVDVPPNVAVVRIILERAGIGRGHRLENAAFPVRIVDRQAEFLLEFTNVQGQRRTRIEDVQQLPVDPVNLLPVIIDLHKTPVSNR